MAERGRGDKRIHVCLYRGGKGLRQRARLVELRFGAVRGVRTWAEL